MHLAGTKISKYGLIGDCYDLKRPRSHPTAKMIEAIKDALKHFEMI